MYKLLAILLFSFSCLSLSLEKVEVEDVIFGGSGTYPAVTFGVFADVHYESNGEDETGYANVSSMITSFWNNNVDVDFIMCMGDQTTGVAPTHAESLADALAVDTLMDGCNKPAYSILGNHEHGIIDDFVSASKTMPSAYYSFDVNGIHFICLESSEDTFYSMTQAQLDWLQSDLAASVLPTIVFIHHRIDKNYGDPADWWPTEPLSIYCYNSEAIRALLEADGDVTTVFSGHYHEPTKTILNGVTYYTVPSCASSAFCIDVTVMSDGICKFTAHNYGSNW